MCDYLTVNDNRSGGEAYDELDELYDLWCAEVVEDIDFYQSLAAALAREQSSDSLKIIELGAGSGRITLKLAAAGHHVTAVEISPAQLRKLCTRISESGLDRQIEVVEADMRHIAALFSENSFDMMLIPFRGMLHVTKEREQIFGIARTLLRENGVLAFDVFHPTSEQIGATHGRWLHRRSEKLPNAGGMWSFSERARYLPEEASEPGGIKLEVDVLCRWRPSRKFKQGQKKERRALLELQLVTADRWRQSLNRANLLIDGEYGWFDARPLEDGDDDSIWVARNTQTAPVH